MERREDVYTYTYRERDSVLVKEGGRGREMDDGGGETMAHTWVKEARDREKEIGNVKMRRDVRNENGDPLPFRPFDTLPV